MTGIIGAMTREIEGIRSMLKDAETVKIGPMTFTTGKIGNEPVVAAVCGIGKVFAGICAQTMIYRFRPDRILNVGVGGALDPDLQICDVVVADFVVQHDMDTSALGDPKGMISGLNIVRIPCDGDLAEKIRLAAADAGLRVRNGVIASGDRFLSSAAEKQAVRETFSASVCEMEGAAVGQVCYYNGVPFCVVRSISDGSGDGGEMDYFAFCSVAAANTERILEKLF